MNNSILVIDDDPMVRHTIKRILTAHGYNPDFAENGKVGLAMWKKSQAALVITDLIMPEKEGLETIVEIRRMSSSLRIIAVSGGGRVGTPEVFLKTAQSLGANEILAKPFEPEQLIAAVKRQLAATQSPPTLSVAR
jgi:DNA-binding response OmpR family regulator